MSKKVSRTKKKSFKETYEEVWKSIPSKKTRDIYSIKIEALKTTCEYMFDGEPPKEKNDE